MDPQSGASPLSDNGQPPPSGSAPFDVQRYLQQQGVSVNPEALPNTNISGSAAISSSASNIETQAAAAMQELGVPSTTYQTTTSGTVFSPKAQQQYIASYHSQQQQQQPQQTTTTTNVTSTIQQTGLPISQTYSGDVYSNAGYSSAANFGGTVVSGQSQMQREITNQYQHQYSTGTGMTTYRGVSGATETRVIGRERGEERVVSVTERVDESRTSIVSEKVVEKEITVPKLIRRQEVIEKVILVPETRIVEEMIEEKHKVLEKIVEIAKSKIIDEVHEIPETEYIETLVPEIQYVHKEKIVEKKVPQYVEKIVEKVVVVPKNVYVDVPDVHYNPVEVVQWKDVEVIKEQVIDVPVPVPIYVDQAVPEYVQVPHYVDVARKIPVPVEAVISYEYCLPRMKPRYNKLTYPVYLPRFVEVPVAVELLQAGLISQTEAYLAQINHFTRSAASLCEIEGLAQQIMKADFRSQVESLDMQTALLNAWKGGQLAVGQTPYGGLSTAATTNITTTTREMVYGGDAANIIGGGSNMAYSSGVTYSSGMAGLNGVAGSSSTAILPANHITLSMGPSTTTTTHHKKSKKSSKSRH